MSSSCNGFLQEGKSGVTPEGDPRRDGYFCRDASDRSRFHKQTQIEQEIGFCQCLSLFLYND